jgi:acetyl esterase/lipase
MKKRGLESCAVYLLMALILIVVTTPKSLAQQNNLSEDYNKYLPELRKYYKNLPKLPDMVITLPMIKMVRTYMNKPAKTILEPTLKEIDGQYGKIGLRIFRPEQIKAVFLQIHGGGNLWGSVCSDDSLNDLMARTCHVAVVSVDYHLAPEFPYPAQIKDCCTAAKWLLQNANKEFGSDKIFIGGGSAGAQDAAATILCVRDSLKAINKVLGVGLLYGIYDLNKTPSHRLATDSTLVLNKFSLDQLMKVAYGQFTTNQLESPELSPMYAKLENLPPAFFMCGTADAFIDDTNFMESRWRIAGNKTFLALFPEAAHGFNGAPIKISEIANNLFFNWINQQITNSNE